MHLSYRVIMEEINITSLSLSPFFIGHSSGYLGCKSIFFFEYCIQHN